MAQSRTAFIPWNESQAGNFKTEYEGSHANRASSHHKREWTMVYLDSAGKPLEALGFGFGTRIHIAGHGDIGSPTIDADHGTGGGSLTCSQLVDLLFDKGLSKRYIGTIACDVCYSALGSPPFAKLLARELWSRGVKASCVLGYKGSLFAEYTGETKPKGKFTHRGVELDDGTEVKSSAAQERFFGWT